MSRLELESKYEELIAKYSKGDFLGKKFDRKNMYSDRRGVFHEDGSEVKRYETCTLCMKAPERGKPFKRCSGYVRSSAVTFTKDSNDTEIIGVWMEMEMAPHTAAQVNSFLIASFFL